ncbi:MAG TPA: DUF1549 domain-containing protein [Gemmataceae bacterium]|nr:DUF1549 domain-containing protein [Gemmataceae bacterium]
MAHAVERAWRPGRALALVAGLLLAGGVLIPTTPAQPSKKPADKPRETKPQDPKPAGPRQKVIQLPSDAGNDVREMVDVINKALEDAWKENKVTPSRPADDYEFIRRASLDIIGRIAKPEEVAQFLKDPKETRRSLLIERLLASPDYPRHWANVWTNWLLSRAGIFGRGMYHEQLATWLEDRFANNKENPWNKIVTDLITATGKNTDNGAVNFILAHVGEAVPPPRRGEDGMFEMVPITSRVTRLFLGVQTQCTQCHDHPFDANLKQKHFWGINVLLRQVVREGTPPMENMRRMTLTPLTLKDNNSANPSLVVGFEKRNGVVLETKPLFFDKKLEIGKESNRREELARLIVEHDNFPKAYVNRIWSVFFSKGLANPIDDFNEQTQVAHPELLAKLAEKFKHYGYDSKKLIRWICNSEAYNLSVVANKTNDKQDHEVLFSRMLMKSMSPEQLFESLMIATQSEQGKDARQQQLDRWLGNLVSNFGDDEGNEVNFNGTVVQALMMMNGQDINDAINRDKGTVAWALSRGRVPAQRVNALYLAALNRPVGQAEFQRIMQKMPLRPGYRDKTESAPYQDLLWALLNSNEFMLNH